jgi:hypothetical protein
MDKRFDFAKLMASDLNKTNPRKNVVLKNKTAAGEPEVFYDLNSDVLSLCETLREKGFAQKAAELEKKFFIFKQAERSFGKDIAGEKIMDKAHPGVVKLKGVGGDTEIENKQDLKQKILDIIRSPVKLNKKADSIIAKIRRFADTRPPELKNFIIISDAVITSGDKNYSSEYLGRTIIPALTDLKNIFESLKSQIENKKSYISAGGLDYYYIKNDLDKKQTDLDALISAISKNDALPGWKDDLVSWISSLFSVVNETNSKVNAGYVGARSNSNFFEVPKSFVQDTISIRMALPYANVIANTMAKYTGKNKKYCYVMPNLIKEDTIYFYNPDTTSVENVNGEVYEELTKLLPEATQQTRQKYLDAEDYWKKGKTLPIGGTAFDILVPKNGDDKKIVKYKMSLMGDEVTVDDDNLFFGKNNSESERAATTKFVGHKGQYYIYPSASVPGTNVVFDSSGKHLPGHYEITPNKTLLDKKTGKEYS